MPLFAVARNRGAAWRADRTPEEQEAYRAHATHMNQLYEEGAVVLGGWLEDTGDVLLIMRAASRSEVLSRLQGDPWTGLDILAVSRVAPWSLGLGTLPIAGEPSSLSG